jgi:hypothetical protein
MLAKHSPDSNLEVATVKSGLISPTLITPYILNPPPQKLTETRMVQKMLNLVKSVSVNGVGSGFRFTQLRQPGPLGGFETALKNNRAKAAARPSNGLDAQPSRRSDRLGFEKLRANAGNILSELARFLEREVDAASQVAHAVGVTETEFGRQFA